jgi:hypothetical protein
MCGAHTECHRQATREKCCGVDCAEENVQLLAGARESFGELVTINHVNREQPAKKHYF